MIVERRIYFSDPTNFNDPLDCNIAAAARLRHALYECKVFCLSLDSCNDFLMFALYADGHRSFRLTFEIDTNETIGNIGVLGRGREVTYVPALPLKFDLDNIHMSLFTKLDCWSYEAEYRILAVTTNVLTYGTSSLVEVGFGCRLNADFEPVIRNWVREGKHKHVRFMRARLCDNPAGYEYIDT